jgi:glycosyltransferase involved in cell wall biosynthesis
MDNPVSTLVLTLDEGANIVACLESLRGAAEVFVVDCGSEDRAVGIAQASGARAFSHPFEGYCQAAELGAREPAVFE